MKSRFLPFFAVFVFILTTGVVKPAAADCDSAAVVTIDFEAYGSTSARSAAVQTALDAYASHYDVTSDTYQMRFDIVGFTDGLVPLTADLTFNHPESTKDIVICGLHVSKATTGYTGIDQALTVSSRRKVSFYDTKISDFSKAILFNPTAAYELHGGEISCSSRDGFGIDVRSRDTIIDGTKIHGCGDGVRINADNITFKNGEILTNNSGINVFPRASGSYRVNVERQKIYDNHDSDDTNAQRNDGIRFPGVAPVRDLAFKVQESTGSWIDAPVDADGVITLSAGARIIPPETNRNSKFEIFLSDDADCSLIGDNRSYHQTCGLIDAMPISIPATALSSSSGYAYAVPEGLRNKKVTAIFSNGTYGSTVISRQFKLVPDIVAIGISPISSIPTTGADMTGGEGGFISGGSSTSDAAAGATQGSTTSTSSSGSNDLPSTFGDAHIESAVRIDGIQPTGPAIVGSEAAESSTPKCALDSKAITNGRDTWGGMGLVLVAIAFLVCPRRLLRRSHFSQ